MKDPKNMTREELEKEVSVLREAVGGAHNALRQFRDRDSSFVVDQPDSELRHG